MLPLNNFEYPHPKSQGTFGAVRKYDIHTGIDLYCDEGESVYAIEDGILIKIVPFTGENAGSPWWEKTDAIMIKGKSGIILYGELQPNINLRIGDQIKEGDNLGHIIRVLKKNKGLPTTMLHLELYKPDYDGEGEWWQHGEKQPHKLMNPEILIHGPEFRSTRN